MCSTDTQNDSDRIDEEARKIDAAYERHRDNLNASPIPDVVKGLADRVRRQLDLDYTWTDRLAAALSAHGLREAVNQIYVGSHSEDKCLHCQAALTALLGEGE